jgi:methionyl-tRNA synthetase
MFLFYDETKMNKKFYITTAIAYPNARPHMWHALEIIQADALARMYRMIWKDVVFQTWTDEHGVKNRRTAQKESKGILNFLDENVWAFKELYYKLQISYDTFLRTSDKQTHYWWAQKLRNQLVKADDIYKKKYQWLYCAWCEKFITEKELIDKKCPDHPTLEIETIEEENYFFKLSKYKDKISELISKNSYHIYPDSRKNEILERLKNAQDISFSRPKETLPRGIPVPNDPQHVMYVRCDALSNYITWQGYENNQQQFIETRPADIHLIGKDILRFHAAFRPAMLLSANIDLPKKLIVHGFLTLNWARMSKSSWNVIDPIQLIDNNERDWIVFQLLYDVPMDNDGDFSQERLNNMYESMLIWWRWNLVNRVTSLCSKYSITQWKWNQNKREKFTTQENKLNTLFESGFDWYFIEKNYLEKADIQAYLQDRYRLVQNANEFITQAEPWKKYKDETTKDDAISDLQFLLYIVKQLALLSGPILVNGFKKIQEIFWSQELNKIDTSKNIQDWHLFKEVFDLESFEVNLNPIIIYQKKE